MSTPASLSFFTDGRPYLTTRQAAIYVGYEPTDALNHRDDKAILNFYRWAERRGVTQQPGRTVWSRADLDRAVTKRPVDPEVDARREAMGRLAKAHAAGVVPFSRGRQG